MNTTPESLSAASWLLVLVVGAIAGAVGQLVRTIAGLGNSNRTSAAGQIVEPFSPSRLVVSLLVGATAGALAALGLHAQLTAPNVEMNTIVGLMAAGYTGADFIEGVAGKYFPASSSPMANALTTVQLKAVNTLSDNVPGTFG